MPDQRFDRAGLRDGMGGLGGRSGGLVFGFVFAEKDAHLEQQGGEGGGVDSVVAGRGQGFLVAVFGQGQDGQGLSLGIDQPVVGDAMVGIDAALVHSIAAAGVGIGQDFAHPIGPQLDRVVAGQLGQPLASPSGHIGLDHLVYRQPNGGLDDQPPPAGPPHAAGFVVERAQKLRDVSLREPVNQAGQGFLHQVSIEDLVEAALFGNAHQIGKRRQRPVRSLHGQGSHARTLSPLIWVWTGGVWAAF